MREEGGEQIKRIPGLPPSEAATLEQQVGPGDTGTQEAKLFSTGLSPEEIQRQFAANEHRRSERFRDHFEILAISALYVAALIFLLVGLAWFYHLLMPVGWHWLNADQVAKLQNVVTGGVLASVAGGHIKKRLG